MQWKITFTHRGFIVAVLFNNAQSRESAIDSAKLHVAGKWDKVRAETVTN